MTDDSSLTEAQPLLEYRDVSFSYGQGAPVLDGFSWRLDAGGFCCILGPSGSGKTTLLYLAAGIRFPSSGQVLLDGQQVKGPSSRTGLMLQDYGLLPWYTARRNLEVGLAISGMDPALARERALAWLGRLGLQELAGKYPAQLSGGQRQRVALARQFALGNELLLLDEPLSAVDELSREKLQRQLFELTGEAGGTTVMVTHNIEEAVLLSSSILLITRHGPIRQAELLQSPFPGRIPNRRESGFQDYCQFIRERLGQ